MNEQLPTELLLCRKSRTAAKIFICLLALILNGNYVSAATSSPLIIHKKKGAASTQKVITGKVIAQSGEGLPGVTVVLKGTSVGTTTGPDGSFSLSISNDSGILVFSFIGFQTQEIPVPAGTILQVVLEEDAKALEEVIVVGYGTQKKSDVTGAISSISSKDLSQTPAGNVMEQAQGRLAGVDIVRANGTPGAPVQIRIRGNRSINASNDPLFVIDGIPTNTNINDFNPNDIQSMEVLKDASSVAIYGSRGANGVILITTKKGKEGKATINYDAYYGIKKPNENINLMNGAQFARYVRIANNLAPNDDSKDVTNLSAEEAQNLKDGKETDWLGMVLGTGAQQEHQVSVSGGSKDIKYYLSGAYFNEEGVLPNSDYTRYSFRVNTDARVSNKLKLGLSASASNDIRNEMRNGVYGSALLFSPLVSPYDADGKLRAFPVQRMSNTVNPLIYLEPNQYTNERNGYRIFANIFADYTIHENINYRLNFGPDVRLARTGIYTGNLDQSINTASVTTQNQFAYTLENILSYKKQFGQHALDIVGLFSTQESRTETFGGKGQDIPIETAAFYDLNSAGSITNLSSGLTEWGLLSYMGRVNYQLKDRYLFTLTGRTDGSSRLATGRKWGFFPSVALGWIISEESFLKTPTLPFLKLRAGYGEVGNTSIDPYQTLGGLSRSVYAFGDNQAFGYAQSLIPNPDLGWEISKTLNLGLDFGLFDNRVTGSLEFYNTNTHDLLLSRLIPITSGYSSILQNIGSTRNRGWELSAASYVLNNKEGVTWDVNFNIFSNKEEIVELFNGKNDDVGNRWFIGQPINVFYSFKQAGIWQTSEADEAKKYGQAPGDIKIMDVNGRDAEGNLTKQPDGKINADDRAILGSTVPKWSGGITNKFTFKGLDFSFLIYARQGQMLNSDFHNLGGNNWQGRINVINYNYWTADNPSNEIPTPRATTAPLYFDAVRYFDGSFVKIRNISLGYNFNNDLISRAKLSGLRLYATINNAITFSKYKTVDPETSNGMVGGNTPLTTASYIMGLSVKF